jgi:hypothetical protein
MTVQHAIGGFILVYLAWHTGLAVRDYRSGKVQVRRWWIVPWYWLEKSDPIPGSVELQRNDAPAKFWFWTLSQALLVCCLSALFIWLLGAQ